MVRRTYTEEEIAKELYHLIIGVEYEKFSSVTLSQAGMNDVVEILEWIVRNKRIDMQYVKDLDRRWGMREVK